VIGGVASLTDAAASANESLAGTVRLANHALEPINGVLHQLSRREHERSAEARVDGGRQVTDAFKERPFRAQRGGKPLDRRIDPLIVGDRGGFDEHRQPRRAADRRRLVVGGHERLSQCEAKHVLQRRGVRVGVEILAQEQRRGGGIDGLAGGDRGCDAGQHIVQFGDPGILQGRNYNEGMIVVRYATLVALVIWIAAMVDERFPDIVRWTVPMTYACGAATVVGLFTLKFLGPPPIAFVMRAGITVLMLAISIASAFIAPRDPSTLLMTVNIGLGLVLLIWYVRE